MHGSLKDASVFFAHKIRPKKIDKTVNMFITQGRTRMKLVLYERHDLDVMVSEQNWPQIGLLSPFLLPLENYFDNTFCRQICGELKVPSFSKITILNEVLVASV